MSSTHHFDLVILGSGSTAFAAALRARELNKRAVMIEERTLGGTCVNRGCLPSKNLIEAARLLYEAQHPSFPGLKPTPIPLDFGALIAQKDELVQAYRKKKYTSLLDKAIHIEQGHARFLDSHTVEVNGKKLIGERVLIATGSRPHLPAIPGLQEVPYLTSDLLTTGEPQELTTCPRSLLIIGGGYIAVELGQMFRRFSAEVTLVERSEQLFPHYEPEVGPVVAKLLQAEGVRILTGATVERVQQQPGGISAQIMHRGQKVAVQAEKLLLATGRVPNTDTIAIENAGVVLNEQGAVRVDRYLCTNVPHIYAAGDVIGTELDSQMATPVGSQDGGKAAYNAFVDSDKRIPASHQIIPRAVFIDPPLAMVGLTEAQVKASGRRCWCTVVPMELVPRAAAIRKPKGFIKMVADWDTSEVLGVTMIGPHAEEVIHEAAMGLRFHATLRDFVEMLHIYPSMAEALKIVAIARYKDPSRLSCCAE